VTRFADLRIAAGEAGLAWRGALTLERTDPDIRLPDQRAARTVVLLGFAGSTHWREFDASPEAADGESNPLDRWSRRIIEGLAGRFGARGLYPNDGPPWLPFQQWARRAEGLHPSPLGILIHPVWGLWHAYRGALAFADALPEVPAQHAPSPCDACRERPCLSTCPAGAVAPGRYDVVACRAHVRSEAGRDCLELGCRARRACPVGAGHRYAPAEAEFHMRAFIR
jgi:ferredoxin